MARWVLHVDMDQFVAAVEIRRHPELRGLPVVVGGRGDPTERGVVSTASYEARAYGVHSGQPLRTAARRCPDAVFLPVDADAYDAASAEVMSVLRDTGLPVEVLGWDEAFLAADTEDPVALAHEVRSRVREVTGLACTIGIGQNRHQAKLSSDLGKPDGVAVLTDATWFAVLGERPTDALWGIGRKTRSKLAAQGIRTVRDLATADPGALATDFGPTIGPWLVRLARGIDSAVVDPAPYVPRSHSRESTFQHDLGDWEEVRHEVTRLAGRVAEDLADSDRRVGRVVVKVRYVPFDTRTHGTAVAEPTTDRAAIPEAALLALDAFAERRPVRLLGVRAEFADGPADRDG